MTTPKVVKKENKFSLGGLIKKIADRKKKKKAVMNSLFPKNKKK